MHVENPENFHIPPDVIKRHVSPSQYVELRILIFFCFSAFKSRLSQQMLETHPKLLSLEVKELSEVNH